MPTAVVEAQHTIRWDIERHPARHLLHELRPKLAGVLERVAVEFGGRGQDYAFVGNASEGINAVLSSLRFQPGDEILLLDHAYGAVKNAAAYVAKRWGATPVSVDIPFPPACDEDILDPIAAALSGRCKLAVLDHVTSDTALKLPIVEMIALCNRAGVPVLVDGAHAPGMLNLDIPSLGADWYVGNLHKWAFAPRACGILWTDPAHQAATHPPVMSWGYGESFFEEFVWTGTHDYSRYLAVPAAFDFMLELGAGKIRSYNHALVREGAALLAETFGLPYDMPADMTGAMTLAPLPAQMGVNGDDALTLQARLRDEFDVELKVVARDGRLWLRVSAQVYNDLTDFERAAAALKTIHGRHNDDRAKARE